MKKHSQSISAPRFVTCALALATAVVTPVGCLSRNAEEQKPTLQNYVADWRDEVIYQVLVDRFDNGDKSNDFNIRPGALARYQGGDWRGLENRIDYLEALGVTTVWISPIVRNVETDADIDAYHGYWAQDLTQLNPHFGSIADLRRLSRALHARGMKVVLDIVTNHMGQAFFYDMNLNGRPDIVISGSGQPLPGDGPVPPKGYPDATSHTSAIFRTTEFDPDYDPRGVQAVTSLGRSGRAPIIFVDDPSINRVPPQPGILARLDAYHARGRITDYNIREQVLFGDFPGGLKDVATENPEVRQVMIDSYARWVEEADLDGFRIDTIKHVEDDFWPVFAKGVRDRIHPQGKTNFFMFGEAFDGDDVLLGSYTKGDDNLDSVFYFSQHYTAFRDVFVYAHDPSRQGPTRNIENLWSQRAQNYGLTPKTKGANTVPAKALVNFIDNHDVARFLFFANGDKLALRNALTFLLTEEGVPCIYYGTEQDFAGGNDPANREVLWPTNFATEGDTFRHIAKVSRLRKTYAALRRGDTVVRFSTPNTQGEVDAGMFAFERTGGDAGAEYALVVLNTNGQKASSTLGPDGPMKVGAAPGTVLVDVLNALPTELTVAADGSLNVTVEPQQALILVPREQVKAAP